MVARPRPRPAAVLLALAALFGALLEIRASSQGAAPIVILISIDAWRWDYLDRLKPPSIGRLAAAGVRAEGLIPIFPSKTCPNHYTIVTGLYPDRHGILRHRFQWHRGHRREFRSHHGWQR